ncbi:MAG: hypothetical protein JNM99_14595 [Verrucomicrobiaceae bacterium]|nr:hypothetical protein [Verrucomicrobiaceae bacterium]
MTQLHRKTSTRRAPDAQRRTRPKASHDFLAPLVLDAVSSTVMEELAAHLRPTKLNFATLELALLHHAREVIAATDSNRRRFSGTAGRDRLHAFMRHWLAAFLQREHPVIYRRLPARYAVGEPLR